MLKIVDPLFKTVVLAATINPQELIWKAAHQDYSAQPVFGVNVFKTDTQYGEAVISMLLAGGKGHFGCLEHPQITFNCCYYPHSVVMQARTHRVGISFDVQSFRYTSDSILSIDTTEELERAFYFRPIGDYTDRKGHRYAYTDTERTYDLDAAYTSVLDYKYKIAAGMSEEHARDYLPSNYRQHFVVSFNLRSLFHFLDLRYKADAQLEIQTLAADLLNASDSWCPELFNWYKENRLGKARLAP